MLAILSFYKTKYFIGGNYEIEVDAEGNQRKLHYLSASTGLFAIFVQENESENMYYIHKDYLGSFQSITDESGELVEKLSFDPWGRRRNADDWSFNNVPLTNLFDRGYTSHQHLDQFGLINMNGRVYDPFVARFLSPDPFVQNAISTQGYNRYSYVSNNPLKFTDPSGYVEKPDDWRKRPSFIYGYGPGVSGTGVVDFQEHGHAYWYDWNSGKYLDLALSGKVVDYQEVFDNYIVPNSAALPSYANINSIEIGQKNGIDGIWYTTSTWAPMARLPGVELSGVMAGTVSANFAAFGAMLASNSGGSGWEAYAGTAASVASEMYYSKTYGTWMGKNFKMYKQTWGGNGSTGGKNKFGKTTSNAIKWGGRIVGAYSGYKTIEQRINGEIGTGWMFAELGTTGVSTFGGLYGAAWGVGWELGRAVTTLEAYQEFKFNFWYNQMENAIGPPSPVNEGMWYDFFNNYGQ